MQKAKADEAKAKADQDARLVQSHNLALSQPRTPTLTYPNRVDHPFHSNPTPTQPHTLTTSLGRVNPRLSAAAQALAAAREDGRLTAEAKKEAEAAASAAAAAQAKVSS